MLEKSGRKEYMYLGENDEEFSYGVFYQYVGTDNNLPSFTTDGGDVMIVSAKRMRLEFAEHLDMRNIEIVDEEVVSTNKKKLIIAVDFDGTICDVSFPEVGKMKPEADVYINKLFNDGHDIIINTCRSGIHEGAAETFLRSQKIQFTYINSNLPRLIVEYGQDCRKISADIYIDDKSLMGLPDTWEDIYNIIQSKIQTIS